MNQKYPKEAKVVCYESYTFPCFPVAQKQNNLSVPDCGPKLSCPGFQALLMLQSETSTKLRIQLSGTMFA